MQRWNCNVELTSVNGIVDDRALHAHGIIDRCVVRNNVETSERFATEVLHPESAAIVHSHAALVPMLLLATAVGTLSPVNQRCAAGAR